MRNSRRGEHAAEILDSMASPEDDRDLASIFWVSEMRWKSAWTDDP